MPTLPPKRLCTSKCPCHAPSRTLPHITRHARSSDLQNVKASGISSRSDHYSQHPRSRPIPVANDESYFGRHRGRTSRSFTSQEDRKTRRRCSCLLVVERKGRRLGDWNGCADRWRIASLPSQVVAPISLHSRWIWKKNVNMHVMYTGPSCLRVAPPPQRSHTCANAPSKPTSNPHSSLLACPYPPCTPCPLSTRLSYSYRHPALFSSFPFAGHSIHVYDSVFVHLAASCVSVS